MCKIKLLVIGESSNRNREVVLHVKRESVKMGHDVVVVAHEHNPLSDDVVQPDEYDLAMVDDRDITHRCSKDVLRSRVPVMVFGDEEEDTGAFSSTIHDAIENSRLRDCIVKVTNDLEANHRMLCALT